MHTAGAAVEISRNRKGRKRKSGRRTASGVLIREKLDYRGMAAAQPHRNWLPESVRLSEKAGTVLGCLNLIKRISDDQYEAGRRYGAIVGAYRAVIGVSMNVSGGGKGYDCAQAACRIDPYSCICLARTEKYNGAYEAIARSWRPNLIAVNRVAIYDEPPTVDMLDPLRAGLNALIHHFGLTAGHKSGQH